MAHLITGFAGIEHIKSADQGSFNAAFFGAGEFVMEIGSQLKATIINNNTVRIADGDLLMQGRHIRINPSTYEDMTIDTGAANMNRIDLIVCTYEKDASSGIETAKIEVVKGTAVSGSASEPSIVKGNILEGAIKNQMPLYRVNINGVALASVTKKFTTCPTYKKLAEQYAAQFQEAVDSYIGALNILDTMSAINSNTKANQLAGALSLKEFAASIISGNQKVKAAQTADNATKATTATTATTANAVAWGNITGKPSTFTPISDYLVVQSVSKSDSISGYGDLSVSVAKSGYTPIGVAGITVSSSKYPYSVGKFDISGTTLNISVSTYKYQSPAPGDSITVTAKILYKKN